MKFSEQKIADDEANIVTGKTLSNIIKLFQMKNILIPILIFLPKNLYSQKDGILAGAAAGILGG